MEFLSRDRYRQAVEELAEPHRRGPGPRRPARGGERAPGRREPSGPGARAAHVGHHLIGKGRPELEADVAWRPGLRQAPARGSPSRTPRRPTSGRSRSRPRRWSPPGSPTRASRAARRGRRSAWRCSSSSPPARWRSRSSSALAARFAPPRRLPRLDLSDGIPEDARTLVVVPTLLTSVEGVERQLEHLEVLALGNLDPHVHFAILGDFTDADGARPARGRRHPRRGQERDRGAERAARRRPRRPVLPVPPRAPVEPGGGRLDGLGAEARQARGAEPAPARRDRHELRRAGRRPGRPPARALLHHARLGHAPPARRREEARRHHRAPAQPPRVRPALRPRHRGLRDPAAARQRHHRERRGVALRADLRRAHRRRPLHDRRLGHLPGPLRRGELHRARGSTTSTPSRRRWRGASRTTRSSRTTSSRASTPAPGS